MRIIQANMALFMLLIISLMIGCTAEETEYSKEIYGEKRRMRLIRTGTSLHLLIPKTSISISK